MEFIEYNASTKLNIGNIDVSFKQTNHQISTYATKIICNNFTLVYLADTGYAEYLCDFCKDADLLICESSFLKGQNKIGNNHLFAHEAAMIAKKSNVGKLLLTHFYPELDKNLYLSEAKEIFDNTIIAEEGKKLILK